MTDNEIIKALECCSEPAGKCCCEVCPLHHREDSCTTALIKKAVELVNRQQAEVERLGKELIKQQLKNNMLYETAKEAKAEAVKEFAERLKSVSCEIEIGGKYRYKVATHQSIDYFVKEMTENITKVEHNSLCETETYKGGE